MVDWKGMAGKVFGKKEPEEYIPQREYIDRRHDNLQRQLSFYEKKREIPLMEKRVKMLEKEVYGTGFKTTDKTNILKTPNHFKSGKGMLSSGGSMLKDKRRYNMLNSRGLL